MTQPHIDAKGGGNLAESSTGPAVNSTVLPSSIAKFNDIEENHSKSDKDIHGYALYMENSQNLDTLNQSGNQRSGPLLFHNEAQIASSEKTIGLRAMDRMMLDRGQQIQNKTKREIEEFEQNHLNLA